MLKTILIILAVIIAIILVIILFILFIPFEYLLNIKYIEDSRVDVDLSYIIFKLKGFLVLGDDSSYELKLGKKVLISSEKDDDEEDEEDSIEDTDFIENEDLSKDVKENKSIIKDLFASAKKFETKKKKELEEDISDCDSDDEEDVNDYDDSENTKIARIESGDIDIEEKKQKTFNIIDSFKNIFKRDEIYVAKKIANEAIGALSILKPNKIKVDIKYGSKDPYFMGLLFSIAAPIYSFLGKKLKLKQNSNSNLTEGHINIVGHPRLYKLVAPIFRLLSDKKFRKFIFKKKKK
jgi:hypothetical protein